MWQYFMGYKSWTFKIVWFWRYSNGFLLLHSKGDPTLEYLLANMDCSPFVICFGGLRDTENLRMLTRHFTTGNSTWLKMVCG